MFVRRFIITGAVLDRILGSVFERSDYLWARLKQKATGRLGASPLQKVVPSMRQLSYGIVSNVTD